MINFADRIRGLFASSQGAEGVLAPDPEWDELLAWAVALRGDDSALSSIQAASPEAAAGRDEDDDAAEWQLALARAKAAASTAAIAPAGATTTWAEGLAQARARRLAEDAEWSACLERIKASREREAAVASVAPARSGVDLDDDAEWQACLARAKAGMSEFLANLSDRDTSGQDGARAAAPPNAGEWSRPVPPWLLASE